MMDLPGRERTSSQAQHTAGQPPSTAPPSAVDAPAGPARPTGAPLADEPPSSVTPTPSNASGSAFRGGDDRQSRHRTTREPS